MGVHELKRLQPCVDIVTAWEVRGHSHQNLSVLAFQSYGVMMRHGAHVSLLCFIS